jgi:hypothetical protein
MSNKKLKTMSTMFVKFQEYQTAQETSTTSYAYLWNMTRNTSMPYRKLLLPLKDENEQAMIKQKDV